MRPLKEELTSYSWTPAANLREDDRIPNDAEVENCVYDGNKKVPEKARNVNSISRYAKYHKLAVRTRWAR